MKFSKRDSACQSRSLFDNGSLRYIDLMKYEYKFLRYRTKDVSSGVIHDELNHLGMEGWKVLNFHPTSDIELGRIGPFPKNESWDVAYVFLLMREIP